MKLGVAGVLIALTLAGCATATKTVTTAESALPACPAGQEAMRTGQLFFGQNIGDKPGVTDADFRKFVDEELTPRFPEGLTVLNGGGQWQGPENKLIRESSKVVVLVLPKKDERRKLGEVRQAYIKRFHQDSVLLVTQDACVSF
jgi:hypothetical protein